MIELSNIQLQVCSSWWWSNCPILVQSLRTSFSRFKWLFRGRYFLFSNTSAKMRVSQWKVTSARVFLAEIWHPSIAECVYQQSAFFCWWFGGSMGWSIFVLALGDIWAIMVFAPHDDDGCCHSRGCWRKPQPGWHQYNTQLVEQVWRTTPRLFIVWETKLLVNMVRMLQLWPFISYKY